MDMEIKPRLKWAMLEELLSDDWQTVEGLVEKAKSNFKWNVYIKYRRLIASRRYPDIDYKEDGLLEWWIIASALEIFINVYARPVEIKKGYSWLQPYDSYRLKKTRQYTSQQP